MTEKERRYLRWRLAWNDLSPEERKALKDCKDRRAVMNLLDARARNLRRKQSDKRTDAERRVLVGARVPRTLAEQVQAVADRRGCSVYQLVKDTLESLAET